MTIETLKILMRIPEDDETFDSYFDVMLPLLIEWLEEEWYREKFPVDENEEKILPSAVILTLPKMMEYSMKDSSVQSVSRGSYSESCFDFPEYILKILPPRKVKFI